MGTTWVPAMLAVVITLILAVLPWFAPSTSTSNLSSLASGATSLLSAFGMGSSTSSASALDESYSVFQFTTLSEQLESYGGTAKNVGSLGLSRATAAGEALGLAAGGVIAVEVVWFLSLILILIGSVLYIGSAAVRNKSLIVGLILMFVTSAAWSGIYLSLMSNDIAASVLAPGLCMLACAVALVLVVVSKRAALQNA